MPSGQDGAFPSYYRSEATVEGFDDGAFPVVSLGGSGPGPGPGPGPSPTPGAGTWMAEMLIGGVVVWSTPYSFEQQSITVPTSNYEGQQLVQFRIRRIS